MEEYISGVVFSGRRVCTIQKVTREQECTHKEAADALESFYNKNLGKYGLWAAYTLSGVQKSDDGAVEVLQLVRADDLPSKRKLLNEIQSERIFALHTEPVENLSILMLPDHEEDRVYFKSDAEHAPIGAKTQIDFFRSKMNDSEKANTDLIVKLTADTIKTSPEVKKPAKKESKSIQNMFVKAMNKEKTPKKSPNAPVRESPFKAASGDELSSPLLNRRRGRKIIVGKSSDEEETPEKKKPKTAAKEEPEDVEMEEQCTSGDNKSSEKKKISRVKESETKKCNAFANADIFDNADDSPEKVAESIPEKKEKQRVVKEKLKGQRKLNMVSKQNDVKKENEEDVKEEEKDESELGVKKIWEPKQETYIDEDGFMVVKSVMQQREVTETEKKPLKQSNKESNNVDKVAKAPPKKAPAGQSKISSFFGKK